MDLRGFRMVTAIGQHPEYRGLGDYFGTETPRPKRSGILRTLDQWIAFAKALAEEHGGVLPCMKWIGKNHSGLAFAMRKHPNRFEHIPQDKPYRTLDQWIAFAKALAKEHGGVLPCMGWIKKNHSGLAQAMRKHPERFEHIPQEHLHKTYRTLDQSVAFAEALAKEHGGVLPHVRWIRKNHPGLASAMRKHPKRFEYIPQEKIFRSLDEWVAFAEALAKEHGGVLPSNARIRKNHSGLETAIRKHPGRFTGLRQEIRDRQGRLTGCRDLGTREAS